VKGWISAKPPRSTSTIPAPKASASCLFARNSWGYTENLDYKSAKEIIQTLIDVVSKNGNLLLNIGPKGDGTIPEKDQEILREIGAWLQVNGQAIYDSRAWRQFGEGPTQVDSGPFSDGKNIPYTNQDFRFTAKGGAVYAFLMEPAVNQWLTIQALADERENPASRFHGIIEKVSLLGYEELLSQPHFFRLDLTQLDLHYQG